MRSLVNKPAAKTTYTLVNGQNAHIAHTENTANKKIVCMTINKEVMDTGILLLYTKKQRTCANKNGVEEHYTCTADAYQQAQARNTICIKVRRSLDQWECG